MNTENIAQLVIQVYFVISKTKLLVWLSLFYFDNTGCFKIKGTLHLSANFQIQKQNNYILIDFGASRLKSYDYQ